MQHAADSKHCRNCGTPYEYEADLPRAPRPLPLPELRPRAARPAVAATRVELDGMSRLAVELRTPEGALRAAPAAARPLQRLQRRCRRRHGRSSSACRSPPSATRSRASAAPSGGSRRSRSTGGGVSILLIKNPAGANEVLRTLLLEEGGSTSGSPSTTASPTGATSPGSGTPTSRCSPAACGGSPAPARAPRRWPCG